MPQITKQIGHVTLWSDEDGEKWETFAFAVDDALQQKIHGKMSQWEYDLTKAVRQNDIRCAREKLGQPVGGQG